MTASRPRYVDQDSRQTLREGIAEYHACNPGLLDPGAMSQEAAKLFRQHDAGHVVFGCDTTLRGETLIDTWTIFGSTLGLQGYLAYLRLPQVNQLFTETGYARMALGLTRCIPDLLRVLWRSRRLARKWPWSDYERHLDRRLCDIRTDLGLRIV